MPLASDIKNKLQVAVRQFWQVRRAQSDRQGGASGTRDAGARAVVTGGAQMDGFVALVRDLLCEYGMPASSVHCERHLELPGWYRPEKQWDLIVATNGNFLAGIEFKSQVGPSFGNNYNNRTEEALGSATDLWAAYREGAFKPSARPWLGYLMLLEDCAASNAPVRAREPHFPVFGEFREASYARRYELLLTKMVRERLYDSACLLLANGDREHHGQFREPAAELAFEKFITSLLANAIAAGRVARRD
ncbi:MAG: PaeR7I family type II restriction endonuclease [Terriglobales bacterium]